MTNCGGENGKDLHHMNVVERLDTLPHLKTLWVADKDRHLNEGDSFL